MGVQNNTQQGSKYLLHCISAGAVQNAMSRVWTSLLVLVQNGASKDFYSTSRNQVGEPCTKVRNMTDSENPVAFKNFAKIDSKVITLQGKFVT
jgi:hypothetical protein